LELVLIIIGGLCVLFTVYTITSGKIEGGLPRHLLGFIKYAIISLIAYFLTKLLGRLFEFDGYHYHIIIFLAIYGLVHGLFYIIQKGISTVYKENINNE
tara:strand:- start:944 stop:1240 length:297 start_codon:yes stop_codon:yes gene_type:complete